MPSNPQLRKEKIDKAQQDAMTLRNWYRQCFESPAGRLIWNDLQGQFDGELVNSLEHMQHVNVGSQRVIRYIRFMLEGELHGHPRSSTD
jgi:hypothetical protein